VHNCTGAISYKNPECLWQWIIVRRMHIIWKKFNSECRFPSWQCLFEMLKQSIIDYGESNLKRNNDIVKKFLFLVLINLHHCLSLNLPPQSSLEERKNEFYRTFCRFYFCLHHFQVVWLVTLCISLYVKQNLCLN
jgi:hypothetical protein